MPRLGSNASRLGLAALLTAIAIAVVVSFGAAGSQADTIGGPVKWGGEGPAGFYDFPSGDCTGNHTDPVGVVFVGKRGGVTNTQDQLAYHAGWFPLSGLNLGAHSLFVRAPGGGLTCNSSGSHESATAGPTEDRFHIRLWNIPASEYPLKETVGTPHHEQWVFGDSCFKHSVDHNGSVGEQGKSGFDWGRHQVKYWFSEAPRGRHKVQSEYWGNDANFKQCNHTEENPRLAGSDGWGIIVWLNASITAETKASSSTATSSVLNGHLHTEEAAEYWFAYGPSPSEGVNGYPNKTTVRTTSGAAEMDVSETIAPQGCLSYVRMFVRNADGDVEEGAERTIVSPVTLQTDAATGIENEGATLNGAVNPKGCATTYQFEYGKTTNYGNVAPVPAASAGSGNSSVPVSTAVSLLPRTRYHFRLVATSAGGTAYGADQAFTTGVKWMQRNSNSAGGADVIAWFGLSGETRVAGDWDGDGVDTPGVYNATTGVWKLRNSNTTGAPSTTFSYGGGVWKNPVVGDWNNDGVETIGVYDPSTGNWALRNSNSAGSANISFQYGGGVWSGSVVGDWNKDGTDTIGVYDPSTGNWALRNTNSAGSANISFQYGGSQYRPYAGDWNGDGTDTIGLFDTTNTKWNLRNTNSAGSPDLSFAYGAAVFQTTVGDWDGNGTDTIASSDANAPTAIEWQLRNSNTSGLPEIQFESGGPEQEPVTGDWDGDGVTTSGRYDPVSSMWRLRPTTAAGIVSSTEFEYGGGPWTEGVVGDWDGDGDDTIGVYDPVAGVWRLRNSNSAGSVDIEFQYGGGPWTVPVVGDWDGDGDDTIGVYSPVPGVWRLRNTNSAGDADVQVQYGGSQFTVVPGDWDGDGDDSLGVYEPTAGQWRFRNSNTPGEAEIEFQYGGSQFEPAIGDWDGDGDDTVGLVKW